VFEDSAVESMWLKAHKKHLTPQLKGEVKALGIDLDAPLKPTYENEVLHACTRLLRRRVYGHLPDDGVAYRAIGEAVIDGFFDTVIGKAMANVFKLIGFKKVIDRLPQTLQRGNTHVKASLEWKGASEAVLMVSDAEPHPMINVGVFERAFRHWFNVPGFKAELLSSTKEQTAYRLTWP
jgi:uncharacterized protein (TIGR02265 family)